MGFEHDLLNREKYADFLTELLDNPDKYKRNSDSNSMCIAIDSGWGTGKTTFINMWKEKLETKEEEYVIINYNAWKNDFAENPLESIVYAILSHEFFRIDNEKAAGNGAAKEILESIGKIMNSMVNYQIEKVAGKEAAETIKTIKEAATGAVKNVVESSELSEFYEKYEKFNEAIETIKEILMKAALKKKIIIIIDELDRCKPIFAIKLLESIKHIFDASGVRFVFALDVEQLAHSIKCVYGQDIDANGYLCRFFDYISKMPAPNRKKYIDYLIERRPLNNDTFYKMVNGKGINITVNDILFRFSTEYNLSLRDIETIYSNFYILENLKLKRTTACEAYALYLFLLILKYKRIDVYNEIMLEGKNKKMSESIFGKIDLDFSPYFSLDIIELLISDKKIKDMRFSFKNDDGTRVGKILEFGDPYIRCLNLSQKSFLVLCDREVSASNVLYYEDFEIYEEIKDKRIAEYIQEKLEIFDFVNDIPKDEIL